MTPLFTVEDYRRQLVATQSTQSIPLEMQQKLFELFQERIAKQLQSLQIIEENIQSEGCDCLIPLVWQQRALEYFQKMERMLAHSIAHSFTKECPER